MTGLERLSVKQAFLVLITFLSMPGSISDLASQVNAVFDSMLQELLSILSPPNHSNLYQFPFLSRSVPMFAMPTKLLLIPDVILQGWKIPVLVHECLHAS